MTLSRFAAASWLATAAIVCFTAVSPAQVISINFDGSGPGAPGTRPGPYDLAPTEVAGALPRANWNNVLSQNATTSNLILATGAATTASVQVIGANNAWSLPDNNTSGNLPFTTDGTMMRGYLDSSSTSTTTVTVTGLSGAFTSIGYRVWVYFDGDNGANDNRVAAYTIGGQTIFARDAVGTNFTGSFDLVPGTSNTNQQANTPAGNYMIFTGLSADTFTLTTTPAFSTSATLRAPINAIQIEVAPVPEPGSLTLLGAAAASIWWARRRSGRTAGP
jgi:hypothetical protein